MEEHLLEDDEIWMDLKDFCDEMIKNIYKLGNRFCTIYRRDYK